MCAVVCCLDCGMCVGCDMLCERRCVVWAVICGVAMICGVGGDILCGP